VLWILPLVVLLAGLGLLAVLAARLRDEIPPTQRALRVFGREVRPALVRVRDETARTRARNDLR